jgi:hypothetical protein
MPKYRERSFPDPFRERGFKDSQLRVFSEPSVELGSAQRGVDSSNRPSRLPQIRQYQGGKRRTNLNSEIAALPLPSSTCRTSAYINLPLSPLSRNEGTLRTTLREWHRSCCLSPVLLQRPIGVLGAAWKPSRVFSALALSCSTCSYLSCLLGSPAQAEKTRACDPGLVKEEHGGQRSGQMPNNEG